MDIKRLKVMLAVDEYGSFTRAGEELGYTQSGVTHMMKSLEQQVGFSLFIKDGHGMVLTEEARTLIPAIRAFLNAGEVIRQEISALNGAQKGTIRIGTYLSCSIHWIPKIIREFKKTYPDIIFKITEGVEGDLAEWIHDRRVDIGFISCQKGHNYQFIPVMEDEIFVVIPENHPWARREEISIRELKGVPFIVTEYTPGSDVHRILEKHKVRPDIHYVTINEFSSLSMVEHGLGVTMLPGLLLRERKGAYAVKSLSPKTYRSLGLAFSSMEELPPAARIFLEYAKRYLLDDEASEDCI